MNGENPRVSAHKSGQYVVIRDPMGKEIARLRPKDAESLRDTIDAALEAYQ